MIDLHVHILPGLDDGPRNLEEAVAMSRYAVADGIKSVVATPHVIPGVYNNSKKIILSSVEELNDRLSELGIQLEVHPGAEYMLDPELPDMLKKDELVTINNGNKYLLVEFPMATVPVYAEKVLFEIALQGVVPIIAHPERYMEILNSPHRLSDFIEQGIMSQITSGSLTGLYGRKVCDTAWFLLQKGHCHLISSDGHSMGRRVPAMSDARRTIARKLGESTADILTKGNPSRILQGEQVINPRQLEYQSKRVKTGFLANIIGWL